MRISSDLKVCKKLSKDNVHKFVTFLWNCELTENDVFLVILGFNDKDWMIVVFPHVTGMS